MSFETKRCLWCGQFFPKLAKSHIIPKAFSLYDGKTDRFVVSHNSYKERRRSGIWDDNILCLGCENAYQSIDAQASEILLKDFEKIKILFGDSKDAKAVQIGVEHIQPLKRFLLYTLWKASVSDRKEFKNISLGPYEELIKEQLISGKLFTHHEYSFVGCRVENPIGTILPFRRKKKQYGGVNYYHLDFSLFSFDIKLDSRKTPQPYYDFAVFENCVFLKLDKPTEKRVELMKGVIREHERNFKKQK